MPIFWSPYYLDSGDITKLDIPICYTYIVHGNLVASQVLKIQIIPCRGGGSIHLSLTFIPTLSSEQKISN